MDLLWAMGTSNSWSDWMALDLRDSNYVGSLQFWQYALCSGTIDGAIRMWDRKCYLYLYGYFGIVTARLYF